MELDLQKLTRKNLNIVRANFSLSLKQFFCYERSDWFEPMPMSAQVSACYIKFVHDCIACLEGVGPSAMDLFISMT